MSDARIEEVASRLVEGYGIIEADLDVCARHLNGWRVGGRPALGVCAVTRSAAEAVEFLSVLTVPATRHVLVPLHGHTACVNNLRNGSDFADDVDHVARLVQARAARVVDRPGRVWKRGAQREVLAYAARILQLYGRNADLLRSVLCMNDGGRWTFRSDGPSEPIETTFDYEAKRKSGRFTSHSLRQLLEAYGLPWLDAPRFLCAEQFVMLQSVYPVGGWRPREYTLEEANDPAHGYYERGLGWVDSMETQAESVVADFERAVRLNPDYEPKVREYLATARRTIAQRSR